MKYNYDVHTTETLMQRVVEAVKEGKEYVPNTMRQRGSRFTWQMDGEDKGKVAQVTVADNTTPQEEFDENLEKETIKLEIDGKTKKQLVEYLEFHGHEADMSSTKKDLVKQAYEVAGVADE